MTGFDPVVLVVGVLTAAIVVLLIRMFLSSPVQPAATPLRTAPVGGGSPLTGQNLSDMVSKAPGSRVSPPRVEPTPPPDGSTAPGDDRENMTPSMPFAPLTDVMKEESASEVLIDTEPASHSAYGEKKDKELDSVAM